MLATACSQTALAKPIAVGSASWRTWIHVGSPLLAILVACIITRLPLATGEPRFLFELDAELLAQPWKLLLPFDFGGGRYRWTPTGHVPMGLLNLVLPAPVIFVLFLGALVVISYVLSWLALRSRIFSGTLAICMGFGTQFNYSYVHNGGHIWIIFTAYLLINLFFLHAVATRPPESRAPKVGFVVSLIVFALCWEQWLDYVVFLFMGCGFFYLLCRRDAVLRAQYLGRIKFVAGATLFVLSAYLMVKLPYSGEHLTPGHESDTIFTYSSPIMAIDDVISTLFTYLYISLTNYCPSWFNASNSLYHVGAERIAQEQHGYHAGKGELVLMHHVFFWHFYAGAVVFGFAFLSWRLLRNAWTAPTQKSVLLFVFVLLICTGFSTHTIIKFRPYLSVPLLAYKCLISVIGVALLLSYAMTLLAKRFTSRQKMLWTVGAVWLVLILVGFERFSYHSRMSQQVGLGAFPSPSQATKKAFRRLFSE